MPPSTHPLRGPGPGPRLAWPALLLLVVLSACAGPRGRDPEVRSVEAQGPAAGTAGMVADAASGLRDEAGIPAVSVAIGWNGDVRHAAVVGIADVEHDVEATGATLFRAGEITQALTAVAVLQLIEREALDPDDDIRAHVPAFPAKRWPVTVEQLLWHGGGIRRHRSEREAACGVAFGTLREALRPFADDPLRHEPGTRCLPSPFGYTLLGCAIEATSGRDYGAYLADRVLVPAGMESTRIDQHFAVVPHRARGYARVRSIDVLGVPEAVRDAAGVGGLVRAPLHDASLHAPGAGLLSTPSDLVRFGMTLLDGGLVSETARRDLWTARTTTDGGDTGNALGWLVREYDGEAWLLCTGNAPGFTASLVVRPGDGTVVAVMANLQRATGVGQLARRLALLPR